METLTAIPSNHTLQAWDSSWTAVTGDVFRKRAQKLAARSRRIALLLLFLWVLNIFDLALTILAHQIGNFTELNPLARQLLDCPASLSIFKVSMISFATVILLSHRHLRLTEISCWGLCGIYVALAFLWMQYFNQIIY